MGSPSSSERVSPVTAFRRKHRTGLVTLVFTDTVGSTALKQRLGDQAAARLFRRHDELIRATLRQIPGAEEIETAGDSFLLTFSTPSDAVEFAVRAHAGLRALQGEGGGLDRIGIHVGEVVMAEDGDAATGRDVFGIQIDACARIMSLAAAGQTLMSRPVFDSARQVLKGGDLEGVGPLVWLNHGPYLLKGLEEPLEICEVREAAHETPPPPTTSEKAQRQALPGHELVVGWRPAVGDRVPNTHWVLEKKLGEGGFGEVWLGRNPTTREPRVFKFCFQAERVRFLKRELTLFRLLKERIGEHPNLVRLHDVFLDQPPFYVEMDYVDGADLRTWAAQCGGVAALPVETRLEIVAQAAEALQAAHEAGVVHRDVKPANMLISSRETGPSDVRVKLTDFGIGQIVSEECLRGITRAGFTQTILSEASSSRTGTQLYMAPELLAGKPASIRADIYSLGVVLYQLLVADLGAPVTTDWARDIADPLLREDLQHCLAGHPEDRFLSSGQLAKNLRSLTARRTALAQAEAERRARERAAYRRGVARAAGVAALVISLVAVLALIALNQSKRARVEASRAAQAATIEKKERLRADAERQRAETREQDAQRLLYAANLNLLQQAWEQPHTTRARQLLNAAAGYPERGWEWFLWQRRTHVEEKILLHTPGFALSGLEISPNDGRILTFGADRLARIWDAETGRELFLLKGHRARIRCGAFSPDGRRVVTGGDDNILRAWDAVQGTPLGELHRQRSSIFSAAFSPDGRRLTISGDQSVLVCDAATGQPLSELRGHGEHLVYAIAFSPNGERIATASADKTARVWDAAAAREIFKVTAHSNYVYSAAFSPDGRRLVTAGADGHARVLDLDSGAEARTFSGQMGSIYSASFSRDGRQVVTGSADSRAMVWDVETGKALLSFTGHESGVKTAAFFKDGLRLATAGFDSTIRIWPLNQGREARAIRAHSASARGVAFSPDGRRIATVGDDPTGRLWDPATGQETGTLTGHRAAIRSVAFSLDGRRIATGSQDQTARLWNAETGAELGTLVGHDAGVWAVAFSPDGARIVTGGADRTARVWNAASGEALGVLSGHEAPIKAAAFSPNGARIVTGSADRTARIWDAATGKELLILRGHNGLVTSAAFSPDGRRLVTGSSDQTARLWDASTGTERATLVGHKYGIVASFFSPDGRRVLTSGGAGIKIWDAQGGHELLTVSDEPDCFLTAAAMAPGGRSLAAVGYDGFLRIWEAATESQVAAWRAEEQLLAERQAGLLRETAAAQEREAAGRAEQPACIRDWLVLAPIPCRPADMEAWLRQEHIPDEANLRPRAGERVRIGSNDCVWTAVQLSDFVLDFNQVLGEQAKFSDAYAVAYLISDAHQAGLVMKVASDDLGRVYLNGAEVYHCLSTRSYVPDLDEVSGLTLKAGCNVLIFRVLNFEGDWCGSIRFTDAAGNPIRNVRATLTPP
ncbi:MAG: protein kinase [Verrucomicrobiia bacterium]